MDAYHERRFEQSDIMARTAHLVYDHVVDRAALVTNAVHNGVEPALTAAHEAAHEGGEHEGSGA